MRKKNREHRHKLKEEYFRLDVRKYLFLIMLSSGSDQDINCSIIKLDDDIDVCRSK